MSLSALASVSDYRMAAKKRLPKILFDYIDGGSYSEATLNANEEAFASRVLTQRVMIDVSDANSRVELFGETLSAPIICAPVGFAGMYARRGEAQASAAAREVELPFCLSTVGICSIEEVAEKSGTPPWFQLYMIKDRDWMAQLLARASRAGCPVLVLTADLQTPGTRYRDIRSGMTRQLSLVEYVKRGFEGVIKAGWSYDLFVRGQPHTFGNLTGVLPDATSFASAWEWISDNFDASVTWDDLSFIREHWKGPIILKGVMSSEDARRAAHHGLDGIVVSNHGGRQLDGGAATLDVLEDVVLAVGDNLPILIDGGVRSGMDVLKAVEMGASACMIGRPWAYALAAGGQAGVAKLLASLKAELLTAQVLSARTRI